MVLRPFLIQGLRTLDGCPFVVCSVDGRNGVLGASIEYGCCLKNESLSRFRWVCKEKLGFVNFLRLAL
jgi:hypothetical protein